MYVPYLNIGYLWLLIILSYRSSLLHARMSAIAVQAADGPRHTTACTLAVWRSQTRASTTAEPRSNITATTERNLSHSPSDVNQFIIIILFFNSPFMGRDASCETPRVMPHCTSGWSLRCFHHKLVGIVGTLSG